MEERIKVFEEHSMEYERWFEKNRMAYLSEVAAVRALLGQRGRGLEVGIGSGRFALPLGIREGVEPSAAMRELAVKRGLRAVAGTAEELPFADAQFDQVLMVTTICFLENVEAGLREALRVLRDGGEIIIGFVDRRSPIGKVYEAEKESSMFYRHARFFSLDEVVSRLKAAGFSQFEFTQTLFHPLAGIRKMEPVKRGHGEGSFVVVKGRKSGPAAGFLHMNPCLGGDG
ncbi:MAG: class I SAM-dependent methyltransferase [Oceanipulchritudo sp.]